ncbi:MAG: radical SAM family heme chaperone HemW [Mycoplasmatota bacterium]
MNAAYIHIPFCQAICSYCDFPKFFYNENWVDQYLNILKDEINQTYKGEILKTIYIGGGTPSCLNLKQLKKLMDIISLFKTDNPEITMEVNIENITTDKLEIIKNKVNRISIGIQSFNEDVKLYLKRHHKNEETKEKIKLIKNMGFNINVDLIYAVENQTLDDLKKDLDEFIKLDVNHISTYSLIIEPKTKLYISKKENIDEQLDYEMYEYIKSKLKENNYIHYEISNFSKEGFCSKHNLVYWNNEEYYGFGLGASGYINKTRYENTKSLNKYLNKEFIFESHLLDIKEQIENELILGFRKIKGINKEIFFKKYNKNLIEMFNIKKLIEEGKLIENNEYIYISEKYLYVQNDILINFIGE